MITLGLTGSIAMGKSTTARLFAEEGAAVWDADAAVARLYAPGGAGAAEIARLAPQAVGARGVDKAALRAAIAADATLLKRIEAAIHPLVSGDRAAFLAQARKDAIAVTLCDVPLLFETGAETEFDAVAVVSAPPELQRARALARPGMTEAHLQTILARQTPDAEKRARADHVIDTGGGIGAARRQVRAVMAKLQERP